MSRAAGATSSPADPTGSADAVDPVDSVDSVNPAGIDSDSALAARPPADDSALATARRAFQRLRAKVTRPLNVRPYLVGELIVIAFLLRLYDLVRIHAEVRKGQAIDSARDLFSFEKWLHIDFEPSLNQWVAGHRVANYLASYWYQFAHISVAMVVLGWCWWCRPAAYRAFRNALVLINLAGLTVFLLVPVAPPRLLPGAGFIDADRLVGFGSNDVGPVTADQYGAIPSLHIAWAIWVVAVTFTLIGNRTVARLWICYPFITLLAIVGTGNHFALDAAAGAILSLAALKVAVTWTPHRWDRARQ